MMIFKSLYCAALYKIIIIKNYNNNNSALSPQAVCHSKYYM